MTHIYQPFNTSKSKCLVILPANTSKSKCLVILPANRRYLNDYVRKCTFYVGDNPIEYVDSFVHLGHVITNHLADNDDILRRRNEFIGQVNNVLCFFSKLKSCIVYKLFQSYCMSIWLWALATQQHSHWRVVRIMAEKLTLSLEIAVQNSLLPAAVVESMFVVRRRDQ